MSQYTGVAVSPGRVIGTIYSMAPPVAEPPAGDTIPEGADPATEAARIPAAAAAVQATLSRLAERAPGEGKKILEATAQMAADPSLSQTAQGLVTSGGKSPERAVWEAGDQVAAMLEGWAATWPSAPPTSAMCAPASSPSCAASRPPASPSGTSPSC